MRTDCNVVDQILRDCNSAEDADLSEHAEVCPSCRERIRLWKEMSSAALSMRRSWESPDLWPRIEQALAVDRDEKPSILQFWDGFRIRPGSRWLAAAAGVALLFISFSAVFIMRRSLEQPTAQTERPDPDFDRRILTEVALREIEKSEAAYIQSIEKLSRLAEPELKGASSPLMFTYKEKLALLDSAIDECRANIDRNRLNAHVRSELLSMYQEKQRTLEDLMKEHPNE